MGGEVTLALPAGVTLRPLREIGDARGAVLHMMRADSPEFRAFGEIYFSEIQPGAVKAWKRHRRQTQCLAVPSGRVEFVMADDRADSPTAGTFTRLELGRPDRYALLVVPPAIWYGWRTLGDAPAIIANCADLMHDPAESEMSDAPGALSGFAW